MIMCGNGVSSFLDHRSNEILLATHTAEEEEEEEEEEEDEKEKRK